MNEYDIKRFALVLAVQAELEAMKSANTEREILGEPNAYSEEDFYAKAEELRSLASVHDHQL